MPRSECRSGGGLAGLFQGFDEEENFGGHCEAQVRGVGEGAVVAVGDDGLEGVDEGMKMSGLLLCGELFEESRRVGRVVGE